MTVVSRSLRVFGLRVQPRVNATALTDVMDTASYSTLDSAEYLASADESVRNARQQRITQLIAAFQKSTADKEYAWWNDTNFDDSKSLIHPMYSQTSSLTRLV